MKRKGEQILLLLASSGAGSATALLFFVLSVASLHVQAQNLIPNPSFEEFNDPTEQMLDTSASSFPGIKAWWSPLATPLGGVTSDTLEALRGNLNLYKTHHGTACAIAASGSSSFTTFAGSGKVFIQAKLLAPLEEGCYYRFVMYVLPIANDHLGSPIYTATVHGVANRLGAYFSRQRIRDTSTLVPPGRYPFAFDNWNIVPQVSIPSSSFITDTSRFTRIAGVFRASGGESYITIGNFYPLSQTRCRNFRTGQIFSDTSSTDFWQSVWFIDSLQLRKVAPPDSLLVTGRDTAICAGDSLLVRARAPAGTRLLWDDGDTASQRYLVPGTYRVTGSFGCGYTLIDTIRIDTKDPLPELRVSDTVLCPHENYILDLQPGISYFLNGRPVQPPLRISEYGSYELTRMNECETDTLSFTVSEKTIDALPADFHISDTSLCDNESLRIPLPAGDFSFHLNDVRVLSPAVISEIGTYMLSIANACDRHELRFEVDDEGCRYKLFVPNAFSPNADGVNDYFSIAAGNYQSFHISIFNRWGQMVYESSDPNEAWDGTFRGEVAIGIYTYKIVLEADGEKITKYGQVTVIR